MGVAENGEPYLGVLIIRRMLLLGYYIGGP